MVNSHSGNNHAAIAPGGKSSRRIALICDWFLPRLGGIELHLADLAAALARKGASPVVITSTPNAGAEPRPELTVTRLRVLRAPGFGFAVSPLLVRRLERTLRDGRFDVVHAHVSVISPFAIAALLAARRLNLPAVVTFHSMLLRATDVMQWADRRWGWSASPILLTAVSKLVAEQARVGAGGKEVLVLPNGVDLDFWPESPRPAFEGNDSRRIVFATAMRLAPKKRPMALIDAFQIARKIASAHERELELRIAGDGPLRQKLEKTIKNSGLSDNIKLLGAMPRERVRTLHAESDVFVMPSTRESFGLAALEARASGLPVVAMKGTGAEDFLEDGKTGMLAGDDRACATHMARLATDNALRARLSGRDAGLARFDWDAVSDQHLDAYDRAAALLTG